MGMVPSYETNEWQVAIKQPSQQAGTPSGGGGTIQIRVLENDEWRDYWVPQDPANTDYVQYQEWLAAGNEPRIVF